MLYPDVELQRRNSFSLSLDIKINIETSFFFFQIKLCEICINFGKIFQGNLRYLKESEAAALYAVLSGKKAVT